MDEDGGKQCIFSPRSTTWLKWALVGAIWPEHGVLFTNTNCQPTPQSHTTSTPIHDFSQTPALPSLLENVHTFPCPPVGSLSLLMGHHTYILPFFFIQQVAQVSIPDYLHLVPALPMGQSLSNPYQSNDEMPYYLDGSQPHSPSPVAPMSLNDRFAEMTVERQSQASSIFSDTTQFSSLFGTSPQSTQTDMTLLAPSLKDESQPQARFIHGRFQSKVNTLSLCKKQLHGFESLANLKVDSMQGNASTSDRLIPWDTHGGSAVC